MKASQNPTQGGVVNDSKKSSLKSFFNRIEGRTLERGLSRSAIQIFLTVLVVIILIIYNNYRGMMRIRQISNLNKELVELRIEEATITTELMNARRLSNIEDELKKKGSSLRIPKSPPVIVEP